MLFGKPDTKEEKEDRAHAKKMNKLLKEIHREFHRPTLTKGRLAFAAAVLALGLAIIAFYQLQLLYKLPFVAERGVISNLSAVYGDIKVMTVQNSSILPFAKGQKVFVAVEYYKNNTANREDIVAISLGITKKLGLVRLKEGDRIISYSGALYLNSTPGSYTHKVLIAPDDLLYEQLVEHNYIVPNGTVIVITDEIRSGKLGFIPIQRLSGKVVDKRG